MKKKKSKKNNRKAQTKTLDEPVELKKVRISCFFLKTILTKLLGSDSVNQRLIMTNLI